MTYDFVVQEASEINLIKKFKISTENTGGDGLTLKNSMFSVIFVVKTVRSFIFSYLI